MVFVGGGHTNTIYARNSNELHAGGYETYLLVYRGELGYFTDSIGAGLKDISCGTSEIIKYIASDLADNPEVMGATGVSAGSMQLGFGLTVYGLEEILDVVLLDSDQCMLTWSAPVSPSRHLRAAASWTMLTIGSGKVTIARSAADRNH